MQSMKYLFLSILIFINISLPAQKYEVVSLEPDGTYSITKFKNPDHVKAYKRSQLKQISGFPFAKKAHPNFKNFRNVSLADLNQDGHSEIIVCLNETLYALQSDGSVLWQVQLKGTSNFPPAIADIDLDGDLEIALQTYGIPAVGNIYLFDHDGEIIEGWPINIDNHFFLNAITLADLDGQGALEIIASERISATQGRVHALTIQGESMNDNWPIQIPGTPAFTPSVGDIDDDGIKELITSTTTALYALNSDGSLMDGFPAEEFGAKFSYQSPIIADLDDSETREIITARHNDLAGTTVFNTDGQYYGAWPDYDDYWTFATPAVVDIDNDGDLEIFYARPYISEQFPDDVIVGYDHFGNPLPDFEIIDLVGSEGILAIADIDADGDNDFVIGNLGLNYKYKASEDKPFVVYSGDLDENGTYDIVLGQYYDNTLCPVRGRQCSSEQMPEIAEKFKTYDEFGKADLETVYKGSLDKANKNFVNNFASSVLVNNNGKFELKALPNEAQFSSINAIENLDLNKDGNPDLLLGGNLYVSEVETGRADAGTGLILLGNGKGNFAPKLSPSTGLYIDKDVKAMKVLNLNNKKVLLVANNNETLQTFYINDST